MSQEVQAWVTLIANIVMALAAVGALQQVSLLKRDILERNERAANEKALEAVGRYAKFAELSELFFDALRDASLPTYQGPVGDFTPESVPLAWRKNEAAARSRLTSWIPAMNELDTLAATLVTGVGSERTAFASIGRSYCANVGHYYDLIARYRKSSAQPHFAAIVALYGIWAPRLSAAELAEERGVRKLSATVASAPSAMAEHPRTDA
jgi:hypothetical protein